MIRKRLPMQDDQEIYAMVRRYLLPMKRVHFPNAKLQRSDMKRRLKKGVTYISATKEGITGFCHAFIKKGVLWIDLIAVKTNQRGQGTGRKLLARAETYGKRRGCETSNLFVDEMNDGGIRFYLGNGYIVKQHVRLIHCYMLEKRLHKEAAVKP